MKLKNILSILCLLLMTVSCSMEDDVMNDISNEIEATQQESKEAYISLGVNVDVLSSKSVVSEGGTDNETDQTINNLAIFLLEGDKVIKNAYLSEGQFTVSDGVVMVNNNVFGILTKKKDNLKVLVAANASAFTADNISNYKNEAVIKAASAKLEDCTKFGESSINWGDYPGYNKINGEEGALQQAPFNVEIKLTQSYARIELAEFNVIKNSSSNKDVDVELIGVELSNVKENGQVDGLEKTADITPNKEFAYADQYKCNTSDMECISSPGKNLIAGSDIYFRAFAYNYKSSSSKMKMKLTYKVGVKTRTKEFTIQGGSEGAESVVAGYIYRMKVTATLRAEQVDLDVVFSIKNWIDGGLLVDGGMKENNAN